MNLVSFCSWISLNLFVIQSFIVNILWFLFVCLFTPFTAKSLLQTAKRFNTWSVILKSCDKSHDIVSILCLDECNFYKEKPLEFSLSQKEVAVYARDHREAVLCNFRTFKLSPFLATQTLPEVSFLQIFIFSRV